MEKSNILKKALLGIGVLALIGGGVVYYMFNQPHRDVQSQSADYSYEASVIVNEYLTDAKQANEKYLDSEGDSKILQITGTVASISTDFNDQKVILLQGASDKAGVSCTFPKETGASAEGVTKGQTITVKGVIRSGASYDEDLEMYENVNLDKCKVIKN